MTPVEKLAKHLQAEFAEITFEPWNGMVEVKVMKERNFWQKKFAHDVKLEEIMAEYNKDNKKGQLELFDEI